VTFATAVRLPLASAPFFDVSMWITLGAALLISTAAFVIMRLYVRTIFRESQRSGSLPQGGPGVEDGTGPPQPPPIGRLEIETEKPSGSRSLAPPRSPTFQHAKTAFRRAACFYALGGFVAAATSAACSFCLGSIPSLPHHRS
jgi:hypothetical protein